MDSNRHADWFSPRGYAPDLHEQLRRFGSNRSWRDDAADLWFACRAQPQLTLIVAAFGAFAGAVGVIAPALLIAWAHS